MGRWMLSSKILRKEHIPPTKKQITYDIYMLAAVRETLRLHPPAAGVARSNIEENGLKKDGREEYVIPKNSAIYIFPFMTHMSEKYWKDAKEFTLSAS
jgi:cytochrome P450